MRTTGRLRGLEQLTIFFRFPSACCSSASVSSPASPAASSPCGGSMRPRYDGADRTRLSVLQIAPCSPAASPPIPSRQNRQERKMPEQLKTRSEKRRQADEAGKKRESILQAYKHWTSGMCATGSPNRRSAENCVKRPGNRGDQCADRAVAGRRAGPAGGDSRATACSVWKGGSGTGNRCSRRIRMEISAPPPLSVGGFRARLRPHRDLQNRHGQYAGSGAAAGSRAGGMLAYKRTTEKHLDEIKTVKKEKKLYLAKLTQERIVRTGTAGIRATRLRASTVCCGVEQRRRRQRPAAVRLSAEGGQGRCRGRPRAAS